MLDKVNVPDGDVLIHAGDSTAMGTARELWEFNACLRALPHKYKIVIAGNHDWLFQKVPDLARSCLDAAMYLQDSEVLIEGLRFYGSPWQPEFRQWAFNLPRGAALQEKWDLIPDGIDVLITHGPPRGILDRVRGGEHLGCEALRSAVSHKQPRLHVFGHIHDSAGIHKVIGMRTTFVNASICTEAYRPTNLPIVIDLERT